MVFCGLYPGQQQRVRGPARGAGTSCGSTTPASPSSRRPATGSASASAAASWACSTWRSSSSGSSARATSTLVQTAPNVTYEILDAQGRDAAHRQPAEVPDAGQIEEFREPFVRDQLPPPGREHRRRHAALRGPPRHVPEDRVPQPDAGHPRLRAAAGGGDLRPLRQAQVASRTATARWTTRSSASAPATWCGSTSWCTASGSTPCRSIVHRDHAERRGRKLVKKLRGRDRPPPVRDRHPGRHRQHGSSPARRSRPCART